MSRTLPLISLVLLLASACEEPHGWFNGEPRLAGSTDTGDLCFGFPDNDQDGFGADGVGESNVDCGFVAYEQGDCDDSDPSTYAGAEESCDGADNNCNGIDDGSDPAVEGAATVYPDGDGDGYGAAGSSSRSGCVVNGWSSNQSDCNDTSDAVAPGAPELCDGLDNDCDGQIDTLDSDIFSTDAASLWFSDLDGDGYGNASAVRCGGASGFVQDDTDCNDSDAAISPAGSELCDDVDRDCSGDPLDITTSVLGYIDNDGDGWGSATAAGNVNSCTGGSLVGRTGDCNDTNPDMYPGAPDTPYDGAMNDCSRDAKADCDVDGDGSYHAQCGLLPEDCNDTDPLVHPGALQLSFGALDSDCDGSAGAGADHVPLFTLDGVGTKVAAADLNGDGVAQLVSLAPGANSSANPRLLRWPAELSSAPNPQQFGTVALSGRREFTEAMDLDLDGADDLLLYTRGESALVTQIGGGLPVSVYTSTAGGGQQYYAVGDVNHDGWGDVFATYYVSGGTPELRHYAVQDAGSFEDLDLNTPTQVFSLNIPSSDAANLTIGLVGDMDGDGIDDLGVGAPEASTNTEVAVGSRMVLAGPDFLWDEGYGYVGGGPNVRLGGVSALGSGDFNGDGYADDLTASVYPTGGTLYDTELVTFHGHGNLFTPDGTFDYDSFSWPTLGTNLEVALRWAGDVDGDGTDDYWASYAADNGSDGTNSYFPDAGAHLVFGRATVFNGYLSDTDRGVVTPDAEAYPGLASGLALLDLDGHAPLDLVLAQDNGGPALFFTGAAP